MCDYVCLPCLSTHLKMDTLRCLQFCCCYRKCPQGGSIPSGPALVFGNWIPTKALHLLRVQCARASVSLSFSLSCTPYTDSKAASSVMLGMLC